MTKEKILSFFKTREHAVISTSSLAGQPEAALVGFGETNALELIFGTETTSRKYKNIHENPKAAFVIGWEKDFITVQYEGTIRELTKEEWDVYLPLYHTKVPSAAHYRCLPNQSYFLVTPTWIRYSDLSGEEDQIEEMTF